MLFRLRYLQHDFELSLGRFIIGRSTECQLSLDDPLVSRKHALLVVTEAAVEVEDLGSRNGVLVNGVRIERPTRLTEGAKITIGSQDLFLSAQPATRRPVIAGIPPSSRVGTETVTSMQPVRSDGSPVTPSDGPPSERNVTSKRDAFRLLGGVADKALALGRAEEAERLLSTLLDHVMQFVKQGAEDPATLEQAGRYGARLAAATTKPKWVDYVIELHAIAGRPCAGTTIDELHIALRKVKGVNITALKAYVQMMKDKSPEFGPAERFLVKRAEGLERLVTS